MYYKLSSKYVFKISEYSKANFKISDVKSKMKESSETQIYYTGYRLENEELSIKDISLLNGNQFFAIDSNIGAMEKFLFMKKNEHITAIHLGNTAQIFPLPKCSKFGITGIDNQTIYKTVSYNLKRLWDSTLECRLEIEEDGEIRVFRTFSDNTSDQVFGIRFSHKKPEGTGSSLDDLDKFIKYLKRIT